jgi:hypothetical protein
MERRPGKWLSAVIPDHRPHRAARLRVEEVLLRVASEREPSDLLAQLLGRDRRVPDLAALVVHAEPLPAQVEVAVAARGELALADADRESS